MTTVQQEMFPAIDRGAESAAARPIAIACALADVDVITAYPSAPTTR